MGGQTIQVIEMISLCMACSGRNATGDNEVCTGESEREGEWRLTTNTKLYNGTPVRLEGQPPYVDWLASRRGPRGLLSNNHQLCLQFMQELSKLSVRHVQIAVGGALLTVISARFWRSRVG